MLLALKKSLHYEFLLHKSTVFNTIQHDRSIKFQLNVQSDYQWQQVKEEAGVFPYQVVSLATEIHEELKANCGLFPTINDISHIWCQHKRSSIPIQKAQNSWVHHKASSLSCASCCTPPPPWGNDIKYSINAVPRVWVGFLSQVLPQVIQHTHMVPDLQDIS